MRRPITAGSTSPPTGTADEAKVQTVAGGGDPGVLWFSVAGGGDPGSGLSEPVYRNSRQSKAASRGLNEPAYRNSR